MYNYPYMRPSLLGRGLSLARGINWSGFLDGTQKTLGVINQAIPIVNQVKPIINNAKTMFKIADTIRRSDNVPTENTKTTTPNTNSPIFYI